MVGGIEWNSNGIYSIIWLKIKISNGFSMTVVTDNEDVPSKWLKEVLRSTTSNTKPAAPGAATTFKPDSIFVGLIAEEESVDYHNRDIDPMTHANTMVIVTIESRYGRLDEFISIAISNSPSDSGVSLTLKHCLSKKSAISLLTKLSHS
jgi:hypothetical protein